MILSQLLRKLKSKNILINEHDCQSNMSDVGMFDCKQNFVRRTNKMQIIIDIIKLINIVRKKLRAHDSLLNCISNLKKRHFDKTNWWNKMVQMDKISESKIASINMLSRDFR